ncbi:MAG: glycosyltransferase [Crocinitomicaceae bacterium]|nr:glycosyltransferase [Crocinitomicaceae bacterium]
MYLPRFSIIIPVYNAAHTLKQALESVIQQNYPAIELIIVDGGSVDQSLTILRHFEHQIEALISEKDAGVYDAINKGLDRATGEWIYILGADDELSSVDTIEKVAQQATGRIKIIYGDTIVSGTRHPKVPSVHRGRFDAVLLWKNSLHQQGAFYHRSVFETFRFDTTLKVLGDYDLHLKLWGEKIYAFRFDGIIARCGAGGLSKQFVKNLYKEELAIKKERLSFLLYLLNIPWVWMKFLYKNV